MNFSLLITLSPLILICQRVSSSRNLFPQDKTLTNETIENVLRKFFFDLNTAYVRKYEPRHITVVGASTNELQQTQPLFENYPYIVCKDAKICAYSQGLSQGSIVIVFLEDLTRETFGKNINILSRCRRCKVLFVSNGIAQVKDIRLIFALATEHVPYAEFAHLSKNVVELYSDFIATNCSMDVRLDTVWRPGFGSEKINIWTSRSRDMNGCPISVSSLTFTPKMMIEERVNSSVLTVVGGREGKLILALAEKFNFTIALRYPSMEDQLKYSRKEAIINDVASGTSEIGIGRLRPTNNLNNSISLSFWYDDECVTWGVPRIINWSNDIVWVEFSWEVWASISLVFAMSCIIRYAYRRENSQEKNLGFIAIFIDAVALHLGNPVSYVSTTVGGRFMLVAYLYYATVITTAYKTSLASILTTDKGTPTIVDVQGIINANLNVGGSLYDYNILKDQVNESELSAKLLERFAVHNNDSVTWDRLMFHQDFAFLARRSSLDYDRQMILKAHESVTYDVLDGCVLAYPTVMVLRTKSILRKPIDGIILRLVESGILRHWDVDDFDTDKLLKRKSVEKYFEDRATHKFFNIFMLYFFCIFVSLLTFLLELFTQKLSLRKRQRMSN